MSRAYKYIAFALFIVVCVCFTIPAQAGFFVSVNPGDVETYCDDYQQYLDYYAGGDCWTCKIFLLIFDAANEVSGDIAGKISGPLAKILAVGLALRIAYHSAIFIGNVSEGGDLMGHLTNVGGMCFRALFAGIFLAGGATVAFDYFVLPIIMSGANYALAALEADCSVDVGTPSLSGPLSGARGSMECMIKTIATGLKEPQAIAASLRCGSMHWRKISAGVWVFKADVAELIHPIMGIWGCVLGIFYWAASFLFPLVLIDIVFRLGLIVGFVPVFAVAWAFPPTEKYAKTGLTIILHCCLTFIVSSLIVGMIVGITLHAFNYGFSAKHMTWLGDALSIDFVSLLRQKMYIEAFDNLWAGENAASVMISTIVISIFAVKIAEKPDELAAAFSGSQPMESCAGKAIRAMVNMVIDIIILIITIISWGASCEMYLYKVGQYFQKTAKTVEEIEKAAKRARDMRKRIKKLRDRAERLRKTAQRMEKAKNYL